MSSQIRRVSVAKHPGVYYREGRDGRRRYEISFTDSTGRRRWKTIDGNLEDARAALDDVRGRKRRGERVAPSRATLAEIAEAWLGSQAHLRPRTRERYEIALRVHVLPRLGRLRIAEISEDHVAGLIGEMRRGVYFHDPDGEALRQLRLRVEAYRTRHRADPVVLAHLEADLARREQAYRSRLVRAVRAGGFSAWTIRSSLVPLSRVMAFAVRRGLAASNPVARLERGERPSVSRREMRILERDEIEAVLAAATARYRPLLMTALFTGVRFGELLGLRWADVDFDAGLVRVRKQLGRDGVLVEPKTPQAVRDVVLMPAVGRVLREHKLASPFSRPDQLVFCSQAGTPLDQRNVTERGLAPALERAGLNEDGKPRLRFHDLRHCFASLLISQGLDVVFVSRQLGHANPSITLSVYAHLFDRVRHAERTSALLEASFGSLVDAAAGTDGTVLETTGGEQRRNAAPAGGAEVIGLQGFSDYRRPAANLLG